MNMAKSSPVNEPAGSPNLNTPTPPAPLFGPGAAKGHPFQTEGWAEVKRRMGWRSHLLEVTREGAVRAALRVLEKDFPKIGYRFFYAPRGPILETGWTGADLDELFRRAETLARERRAVFLKIDPDVPGPEEVLTGALRRNGFRLAPAVGSLSGVQPRCVFRLDLRPTEEALLAGMDQKARYNIRLAEKKGVTVRPVSDRKDVETFFRLLQETAVRDKFLIRPLRYLLDIQEQFESRGDAQFFLAEREGQAIAGALALKSGPLCLYAYGASANTGRQYMPNHLVQWTMVRWAKAHGCLVYDFRGVPSNPLPDDPLFGLFRFKKGFGGVFTEFIGEFDRVYVPWLYWLWIYGWPLFKKIRHLLLFRRTSRTAGESD